jgi:flagellar biosynthesis/type III secretory pathway chaperone
MLAAPAPLDRVIERLEEVVDQETAALRNRTAIDLKDFNNRKSQGLLELNRALRGLDTSPKDRTVTTRLAGLRAKLDVNRAVLETHLAAVREVATVLADAIRDAESDGTYSPSIGAGGGRL